MVVPVQEPQLLFNDAEHYTTVRPASGAKWDKNDLISVASGLADAAAADDVTALLMAASPYPVPGYEGGDGPSDIGALKLQDVLVVMNLVGGAAADRVLAAADIGGEYGICIHTATGHYALDASETIAKAFRVVARLGDYYGQNVGGGDIGDTNARVVCQILPSVAF